jgi:hypothetical protein
LNSADVPSASAYPEVVLPPPPASVTTLAFGKTMRTTLLPVSATSTLPVAGSIARPLGALNSALVPAPSAQPDVEPPARVVTVAFGKMIRTRLLSATSTLPLA